MSRKMFFGIVMLVLLLTSILTFAINIQQAEADLITVSKSKKEDITVSFSIPEVVEIEGYDWLRIENCSYFTTPGQPMLPVRSLVFKLREGSTVTNIELKVEESLLQGKFRILPVPSPSMVGLQTPANFTEDPDVYNSTSLFPNEWYVWRHAHGMDVETTTRVEYILLNLFPLRFLPAENKVLRAENISITINYIESEISAPLAVLKNLIITSPTLEPYAVELAKMKNNTGISSKVLNTTWIYHNYGGIDRQEQIRTCIKAFVATYGITYITIFGDADQVPVRNAYVPDGQDTYTPTDLYYADLDGTWDDNKDGLYADQRYDNVDGIPDVYVGRIPPSLAQYAQVAVDKIKGYQQQFDPSESWTRRVVLAAGTGSGDGFSNPFGTAFPFLKNYTANICIGKDVVKLYESYGNLSTGSMASEINKGALFVNFAGHGDPGMWLFYWVIPGLWWNGFGISDVQSLTNGFKLPVVTTMACSTARFDDTDCIGEWFVLEPDGGGIAYYGATRIAWGYANEWVTTGLMGEMDWRIYGAFYEGHTRLGQMWGVPVTKYVQSHIWNYKYASKYDVKTLMEFVMLGDPTLRIYHPNYPETLHVPEDYPTIQTAINAAYDGDTIDVSPGTYYEHVVVNKSIWLVGESPSKTVIDGGLTGIVVNITANNVIISNFSIRKGSGTWPGSGISLARSANVTIRNNNITNNQWGILLAGSSNNTITMNDITNNNFGGIYLAESSNNSLTMNTLTNNGPGAQWAGIYIFNSSKNSIVMNTLTNNYIGIRLDDSSKNSISMNNVTEYNFGGIYLNWASSNNTITMNDITNNGAYGGIWLQSSSANIVYHNNFVNNTMQVLTYDSVNVWDDGYPSGGNYWSNYAGYDLFNGPYQNITGSDGIGDTPYIIDANNKDTYPFMNQIGWKNTELDFSLTPNPAYIGQTVTMLGKLTDRLGNPINNTKIDVYVNGKFTGSLFTNSSGWFTASAKVDTAGTYNITVTYSGSETYNPSSHTETLTVYAATITVWTDRTIYHTGETMKVYVRVKNGGVTLPVRAIIALKLPNGTPYTVLNMTTTLPANYDSGNILWQTYTIPNAPLGNYTWIAELRNPTTGALIWQSTWNWSLAATAMETPSVEAVLQANPNGIRLSSLSFIRAKDWSCSDCRTSSDRALPATLTFWFPTEKLRPTVEPPVK